MNCALCGHDGAELKPTLESVVAAWEAQAPRVHPLCPDAKACLKRGLAQTPAELREKLKATKK